MKRWEESTPYVQDYRQWFRFANVLVMRVQEASKPDSADGEGAWFNWWVAVRLLNGDFSEARSVEEGGAATLRGAKRDCNRAARAIAWKTVAALEGRAP